MKRIILFLFLIAIAVIACAQEVPPEVPAEPPEEVPPEVPAEPPEEAPEVPKIDQKTPVGKVQISVSTKEELFDEIRKAINRHLSES